MMRLLKPNAKTMLAALLSMSCVVWTLLPSATHSPTYIETLQEHAEMIANHGHSHGFVEDIFWALHGHDHDAADHDHSHVMLAANENTSPAHVYGDVWNRTVPYSWPSQVFRIDRPPRA